VRAEQFITFVRCAILAICFSIAIPLCFADCGKTSELGANLGLAHSPTSIQMLARELQGKKGDEVATAIIKQFGPAARDVGSGLSIQQWDVDCGVLTYSLGLARFRSDGGKVVWLTPTVNKALLALTAGTFEMYTPPVPQMK